VEIPKGAMGSMLNFVTKAVCKDCNSVDEPTREKSGLSDAVDTSSSPEWPLSKTLLVQEAAREEVM